MKRNKQSKYRMKIIQEFRLNKHQQQQLDFGVKVLGINYKRFYFIYANTFVEKYEVKSNNTTWKWDSNKNNDTNKYNGFFAVEYPSYDRYPYYYSSSSLSPFSCAAGIAGLLGNMMPSFLRPEIKL